ncbi:hypothetical protein [Fervidicella metallireducens]|nr:hypothetical protein [Fervidicella metallireducens]
MKRFKVNKALFLIFPIFLATLVLTYVWILYSNSYKWVNILNLSIDSIFLIWYLNYFCHEVSIDSSGINFYTLLRKTRIDKKEFEGLRQSSFLTKVYTKRKHYYILTSKNGKNILGEMFKEINK